MPHKGKYVSGVSDLTDDRDLDRDRLAGGNAPSCLR